MSLGAQEYKVTRGQGIKGHLRSRNKRSLEVKEYNVTLEFNEKQVA